MLLLAAAPAVLVVQGLPGTKVVGAGFGVQHLLAHRLVVLSLVLAALAALADLLELDLSRGNRRSARKRLRPDGVAIGAESPQATDGRELGPDDLLEKPRQRPEP